MMPLLRYFVGVGALLVALLLAVSAYAPDPQRQPAHSDIDKSTIRIARTQKGPELVVIDTSIPTTRSIIDNSTAEAQPSIDLPPASREAFAQVRDTPTRYTSTKPVLSKKHSKIHRRNVVARNLPPRKTVMAQQQAFPSIFGSW